jgi:hypothetical protein
VVAVHHCALAGSCFLLTPLQASKVCALRRRGDDGGDGDDGNTNDSSAPCRGC